MPDQTTIEERVRRQLRHFLENAGIHGIQLRATTDLIEEAGLSSLQGLEFVLELCDEFEHEFPTDFNPFVDDEHHRGQTYDGLVKAIDQHLSGDGASNGKN